MTQISDTLNIDCIRSGHYKEMTDTPNISQSYLTQNMEHTFISLICHNTLKQ